MGRAPCCDKANVKKGPWSPEEDAKLKEFMDKYGTGGNWIALPQKAGLKRCGKSCRLRWLNYLRPNIKHGEFSDDEDKIICTLYATIGSRWSIIAAQLPGRTDNDIKNYWNTKLKKKLMGMMTIPSKYSSHPPFSSTFQTQSLSLSSVSQLYRDFNSFYLQNAKYLQPNPAPSPQNLLYSNSNNNSDTFSLTPSHYPYFSQNQEGFVDLQCYSNGIESNNNNNNMLVFGGGNEASCSSSDGSCSHGKDRVKQEEIGGGFQGLIYGGENPKFMLHNGMDEILGSSHHELQLQMQRDVEEVKQLISSGNNNNSSSVGNGSNSSFMFNHDDDEREMYYF